jgi:PKD repeat protein
LTVDFSDLTTGSVDSWKWDFNGDYLVDSTEQNPSFTYNAANHVVTLLASGPEGKGFLIKDNYLSVTGDYVGPRVYKIRGHKEPGRRIRIIGSGFGDIQGDSVVYIGKKAFDSSSRRIKLWTDTKIIVKLPNYRCKRFKRDFRLFGVRVTDGFYTSAFTNFKVLKPDTCP